LAGTRGDVKSDDIDKIRYTNVGPVLLAGNMSQAKALFQECDRALDSYTSGSDEIAFTTFKMALHDSVRKRKRAIADSYVSTRFGLSYDEVFNFSNANPGNSFYLQIWQAIEKLTLQSEMIVGTFSDDEAAILVVEISGEVIWADHSASIGTGSRIASAFLPQRDYDDEMTVEGCLYRVLEAKTAAEKDPYVGIATVVELHTHDAIIDIDDDYVGRLITSIERRRAAIPKTGFKPEFLAKRDDEG
jgi:hypothetical protein